eukprot:TRINITY_DN39266_c0_g1_i1.p1 TRINITY_DN39266_c0_g1~~TRINITY_DN39266_c0_g1_i1.p1  ORF type:complete len:372 (-),score=44.82 TRINITY_DN39266_c0_g1_i1:80-1066(-)
MIGCTEAVDFPAFDIAPFVRWDDFPDEARRAAARAWDDMFKTIGFAVIDGHGVSTELLKDMRRACKSFFHAGESYKMRYSSEGRRCGFSALGGAKGMAGDVVDPVEGYTFMITQNERDWDRLGEHPKELVDVSERYYYEVLRVMKAIHKMSAMALGLDVDFFERSYSPPSNCLVNSHYPALSSMGKHSALRYRAHSDYTGFTILYPDESDYIDGGGGLEIDIEGTWVPIKPRAGCFVINIGDLFETWTNKRWKSTPHRVTSPKLGSPAYSRERYSTMLFSGPNMNSIIAPIETCVPKGSAPPFRPMKASAHLYEQYMSKSKEALYAPS